jgi:hypothetical protein
MKRTDIMCMLLIMACTSLHAQTLEPGRVTSSLNVYAKGSDVTGLLGAEYQYGNFAIGLAWRPIADNVDSYSMSFTVYQNMWYQPSMYLSFSSVSLGYPYSPYYPAFGNYEWYPSVCILVGYRAVVHELSDRLSCKVGIGCNFSNYGEYFATEVGIVFVLFKNIEN